MANDKKRDDKGRFVKDDDQEVKVFDPFVGGEDDDLMDMEYVQDADTVMEDTHPPETIEEAEQRAEMKQTQGDDDDGDEAVQLSEEKEEKEEPETPPKEEVVVEKEPPAGDDDEPRIPKARFDEVNEQKKKAQERAEKLEKQVADLVEGQKPKEEEPEPFDYATKEKESYDAFLEGDTEKYSAIQEEIRAAQKAELQHEAQRIAAEGDSKTREELTFEETGAKIESEYPEFVKENETFNQEAYDDLMELYVGYVSTGRYTKADALQMAADKSVRIYGLEKAGEETLTDKADNVVSIKKPDIEAKKEIAEKQPPIKDSGTHRDEEPKLDVSSMSDEEFSALPEATKRRMRGDIL
jgi:hypothetical protein